MFVLMSVGLFVTMKPTDLKVEAFRNYILKLSKIFWNSFFQGSYLPEVCLVSTTNTKRAFLVA